MGKITNNGPDWRKWRNIAKMKRFFSLLALFAALTWALPVAGAMGSQMLGGGSSALQVQPTASPAPVSSAAPSPSAQPAASPIPAQDDQIPILNTDTGQVEQIPLEEFVLGSVASEMPITWPDEALKAQAIASRSYALARVALNDGSDPTLQGAAFSASPAQHLGFVKTEQMQQMWGDAYQQNYDRLKSLVDATAGQTLEYEGQTALACYHAISAGHTEASENVWSTALPYLCGVDSVLDLTSPDLTATVTMTSQEVYNALQLAFPGLQLDGDPVNWFGQPQLTAAGYIDTIPVGPSQLAGPDVRQALGLRSACFTVAYADGQFTFTTTGYGHGVGMSQYGAYALALTGQTCDAILATYYPGTTLTAAK